MKSLEESEFKNDFLQMSESIKEFEAYNENEYSTSIMGYAIRRKGYRLLPDEWTKEKILSLFIKEYNVTFKFAVYLYWGRWSKITNGVIPDNYNPTREDASQLLKYLGEKL